MLNRAQMRAASENFRLLFWKSMQSKGGDAQVDAAVNALLMQVPESDWKGLYRWFLGLPIMRHWVGDRQASELNADGFELVHKPYEATIKVMADDIKFDRLGGYKPAIATLANEVKLLKFRELVKVMEDARVGTVYGNCYDGYPLISASHTTGSNTGTAALAAASLEASIAAMIAQHDVTNTDDRLLIRPKYLWYHDALQATVEKLIDREFVVDLLATGGTADYVGGAVSNIHYKKLIPLPLPMGSSYVRYWGLLAERQADMVGPLIWQYDPAGGSFDAMDQSDDEPLFMRREIFYGVSAWGAMGPGFPQYIWGSDGTT